MRKKGEERLDIAVRLVWPTEITETDFFREMQHLPKARTYDFLQRVTAEAADAAG